MAAECDGAYFIVEVAHRLNQEGAGLTHFYPVADPRLLSLELSDQVMKWLGGQRSPDRFLFSELGPSAPFIAVSLKAKADASSFVEHHVAHAANSFYQSPFDRALVITCDSGGDDGTFNVYRFERQGDPVLVARSALNVSYRYAAIGALLRPIRALGYEKINLVNYGHLLMNLAPYGTPRSEWIAMLERLLRSQPLDDGEGSSLYLEPYHGDDLVELCNCLAVRLGQPQGETIDGQLAYDLAASAQAALENVFLAEVAPHIAAHGELPICLGGGMARNSYLTRRLRREFGRDVFVPVNCDNAGVALGMIVSVTRPQQRVDLSQVGPILCDLRELNRYAAQRKTCNVSPRGVARFLADGKILGVARGRAENGAYSLGARSILCDAAAPNVGYLVRRAIKQVPDFIPFDAIVRRERVDDYFDDVPDEVWPTYPLQLKKQYGDRFCSVVHIDGAVRVFAVDEVQNPWLYELLRWFETYSGHGILLTTLFGAQNGGAVASIAAALAFLDTTLLDGIVVEDVLMWRKSEPNGRPLGFERL